jgi:formylglycine-generating enzyme required for sulfatase activity
MPSHKVKLDAFFISKYELSQAQWGRIMEGNPAAYAAGQVVNGTTITELHPIEQISWAEAITVMRRFDLSLPTEAQWEYANRAGTKTIFWTGNTVKSLANATNISDQQSRENGGPESWAVESVLRDPYIVHGPIGQFRANPFGLHDSIGNVWEWCLDNYGEYTLPVKSGTGERMVNDDANPKLFRGGGFRANSIHVRSADRYSIYAKDYRAYDVGVRPARKIE